MYRRLHQPKRRGSWHGGPLCLLSFNGGVSQNHHLRGARPPPGLPLTAGVISHSPTEGDGSSLLAKFCRHSLVQPPYQAGKTSHGADVALLRPTTRLSCRDAARGYARTLPYTEAPGMKQQELISCLQSPAGEQHLWQCQALLCAPAVVQPLTLG